MTIDHHLQQIESVEKEVARLLNRDKQAFEVTTQWRLAPSNVVNNDHDQGTEAGSGGDSGSEEFDEDALAKDLERGVADNSYGQGYGYGDDDDEEEEGSEEDEAATRQAALNERQTRLESELNELRGKIAEKEAQTRSNNEWTKNTAQQQLASLRRDYNEKIKMLHETQRQLRTMR